MKTKYRIELNDAQREHLEKPTSSGMVLARQIKLVQKCFFSVGRLAAKIPQLLLEVVLLYLIVSGWINNRKIPVK